MFQERKNYRKNFTSSGQLHLAGETLEFIGHDVSVHGILIEVLPGSLLTNFQDFENVFKESNMAEVYVRDLMLTGTVEIAWLRHDDDKILMGLEFREVMYNADKLWLKRQNYRKQIDFVGHLLIKNQRVYFDGKNISVDGLMIYLPHMDESLHPNHVVRLFSDALHIKAMAKICWIRRDESGKGAFMGLRYLAGD